MEKKNNSNPLELGEVRLSQILWTYGPGALIDLPNLSVINMGLQNWKPNKYDIIQEPRLLIAVRKIIGNHIRGLTLPPFEQDEEDQDIYSKKIVGIPVLPFPQWLCCKRCHILAPLKSGFFSMKPNKNRPENIYFYHNNCEYGKAPSAVPARLIVSCRLKGHLDDFPWDWFVHHKKKLKCTGGRLRFSQQGSLSPRKATVKCVSCNSIKSISQAFDEKKNPLPLCRGRHPHLNLFDKCDEPLVPLFLGASNNWFPNIVSALSIPKNELKNLGIILWDDLKKNSSHDPNVLKGIIEFKRNENQNLNKYSVEDIFNAITKEKEKETQENSADSNENIIDIEYEVKVDEWDLLISDNPVQDEKNFKTSPAPNPEKYKDFFQSVLLLERLKKVNALIGFTRVEPMEQSDHDKAFLGPLTNSRENVYIPAAELNGEGIFIAFNEEKIAEWEKNPAVQKRHEKIKKAYKDWIINRNLLNVYDDPEEACPEIRFIMLHTFSHLLIREVSLECGYNAANIEERIYASSSKDFPMAGILIYPSSADSDGTLGGLVDLGKSDLERLIDQALKRALLCTSDPLCSEHDPSDDDSLHLAACHACTFLPETSCEKWNFYLDRALVLETLESKNTAFFPLEIYND